MSASFVVAVAAVIVRDGRVLALRRSPTRDVAPGLWEVCSGRVEPDEQPSDAVAREIAEETGLTVAIDDRRSMPRPPAAAPTR